MKLAINILLEDKVQAITNEISSMSGFPHDSTQLTFVAALQVCVRMVHASYDQVLKLLNTGIFPGACPNQDPVQLLTKKEMLVLYNCNGVSCLLGLASTYVALERAVLNFLSSKGRCQKEQRYIRCKLGFQFLINSLSLMHCCLLVYLKTHFVLMSKSKCVSLE